MEPIAGEPDTAGRIASAGKGTRFASLLLLFLLLAPSEPSRGLAATPGDASSPGIGAGDHSAVLPGNARASERLFGLPGLGNVGRVAPGILRGAQPKPEGYATLKAMGVKTVINLRTNHGEKAAVEAAGMRSVEIPMTTMKAVDPAAVRKAISVMTDPANQPVFVHCAQGKDRTGVVAAVYRMEVEGWTAAEAEAEMEAFGFHEIWFQLEKFVRRYPESRKGNGAGTGR
ncbi:MAG TPA: tyrosine-protein phosphatase [Candidatus Deferrimicrobiaceae bacterium]